MHHSSKRLRRTIRFVMALATVGAIVAMFGASGAWAAAPKALINDSTVSGGYFSEEAQFASAQGYAVTVVSDATWGGYTAADFGQYDILIAGDPTCGSLPPGLVTSAPVWGSVVLGLAGGRTKAGNRTIVGTDPVFHSGSTSSARAKVINDGIKYAGLQPGTTGMYLDTTCAANYFGQSAETLAVVQAISAGLGSWTIDADPPCGGNVSLIASNPAFADLTTADLQGWGCSVHESFPTFPSDWSALAVATDTPSHPTCGVDPGTGNSACGEAYILISGSNIVVISGSIAVTPTDATNPTGTDHTVSAHVTAGGSPLANQVVTFTVTGQNAGALGTCVPVGCITDANGDVSFTYHDSNGPGDDTIKASFTDAAGSLQSATAQKHWVGAVEKPITASGISISTTEGSTFTGAVATINDPDAASTAAEYTASINWGDGSPTTAGSISGSGGNFTVSGSHTYAEEGSYTVTVTVTDIDSPDNGATATGTATVADAAISSTCAATATSGLSFAGAVASLSDANSLGSTADFTATINWGDSSSSAGTVSGSGGAYTVTGSHNYGASGNYTITTSVADDGGSTTSSTCRVLVYAGALGGGAFVIGNNSATGSVTFWGAQWWKVNSLSGGAAPAAFKGFALNPAAPSCGVNWSTDPGNSAPPPAGPLPAYMAVIVSSSISKSGSQISGNTQHIVIVKTNPGYDSNPGHAGTGTVVATVC